MIGLHGGETWNLQFENPRTWPCIVIWTCSNSRIYQNSRTYQHYIRLMWRRVFVFVPGINWVSSWVYTYMPTGSYLFKNPNPSPTSQFLKVNTLPHLIIDDLKFLNIHNRTPLKENNNVWSLSKTQINNHFISRLGYLQTERKKNSSSSFSCYK
jgi:hypothetical protein